jgi:eukaryotic-like serine/threonine-protein kinase
VTPERWRLVTDVFHAARERDGIARAVYLADVCDNDTDLRAEVDALLAASVEAGAFGDATTNDSLAPGTCVGPYRVEAMIGAGGMGEVYRARDTRLGRTVAVKILPRDVAADPDRRRRFEREARTIASLTHPHICTLYDVGEHAGSVFLVMEHLDGDTLAARLRNGALPLGKALSVATEIAEALNVAHKHGVIHRDLKPANVMLTSAGVKLLDFGVAKLVRDASPAMCDATTTAEPSSVGTGRIVGTLGYMSPEQVRTEALDARTDLFSLGVVLYEMTTGRRPFAGNSAVTVLASLLEDTPPAAKTIDPRLPDQLDRILRHALAKLPDRRYQTAQDLRNDLAELTREIDAGRTGSTAIGPARRARTWLPRIVAAVAALALVGTATLWERAPTPLDRRSVAILPLKNLSGDPENEYFSDGIGDDIIAALSKLGDLRVIAAASTSRYRNSEKRVSDIGRELGVATLLVGSVRRAGGRLRIVSELVDARTGQQLWAETYDREIKDVFAIQTDVSRRIAEALKGELSPYERARIEAPGAANVDAFNLYLKGRYFWTRRTPDALRRAIGYFQEAIAKEPRYALAYAGLADSYNLLAQYGTAPPSGLRRRADEAATTALSIDPTLAEAHASKGLAQHARFDWRAAGAEFRRALELDPNYATAHHWFAIQLAQLGRFDEAVSEIRRAQSLDPLSIGINAAYGAVLYLARRYDAASTQLKTTIDMEPNFPLTHAALAEVYIQLGVYDKARGEYQAATALGADTAELRASTAYLDAVSGRREAALRELAVLEREFGPDSAPRGSLAVVYAALGDKDRAFVCLDEAYARHDEWLVVLKVEPKFDQLRSDPRFDVLLRRTGLEQ